MSTDTYPHPSGESCPACHGCQTCHRWYHGHHCPCQAWIEEFMPPETAGSAGQDRITTTAAKKRATPKPKRAGRRNVVPGSLSQVLIAAKRDYEQAKARYESIAVVVGSHTLWEHEDGRDLCDHDGQPWPCSTVVGFGFIYGADVPEQWERTRG